MHYVGDQWAETNGPIAREIVLREAAHYLYPDTFPAVDVRAEASRARSGRPAEVRAVRSAAPRAAPHDP